MRIVLDLTFNGPPVVAGADERVVTLGELVAATREPRRLIGLLRDPALEELLVLRDARALNGVQSGALLLATLSRARRVEVRAPGRRLITGAGAMRARAAGALASALPAEVARSVSWHERARRAAATEFSLPSRPAGPVRRITYLRAEPSLRWLGAQVGGAATHTAGVINGLTDSGIEVDVFAPERPEGVRDALCHEVPPRHIVQLVHWLTLTGHSRELARAASGVKADVVYQRYALGSYAGLALARRLGVPLVLEFNGSEIWAERNWGSGTVPLARTLAALERRNLLDASLIVVVSRALEQQLLEQGIERERVLVNPNGVDIEALAEARARTPEQSRASLGLAQSPTIGFVGTFGPWHGVELLPELIARVAVTDERARWVLIGDGPLHRSVAAEIARRGLSARVLLTGMAPNERAVKLLACCEVCVSPHLPNPDGSPFFGSPTKLFEYMGLGRAIVASNLEQIGEVLDDRRTALLVAPGDVNAAALAVSRLLADREFRISIGESALRDAEEKHGWDSHVGRILNVLGL